VKLHDFVNSMNMQIAMLADLSGAVLRLALPSVSKSSAP
jgi:hypothetical protein